MYSLLHKLGVNNIVQNNNENYGIKPSHSENITTPKTSTQAANGPHHLKSFDFINVYIHQNLFILAKWPNSVHNPLSFIYSIYTGWNEWRITIKSLSIVWVCVDIPLCKKLLTEYKETFYLPSDNIIYQH